MHDTIISTFVHLRAVKCIINGEYKWHWVVTSFEGGRTFQNGQKVEVCTHADSFDGLFNKKEQ